MTRTAKAPAGTPSRPGAATGPAVVRKLESRAIQRGLIAGVLAWLFPGAGHLYVGARTRAAVFCGLVLVTVALGALFDGNFSVTDFRTPVLSRLQVASDLALGPMEPLLRTAFYGSPVYRGPASDADTNAVAEARYELNAAVQRALREGATRLEVRTHERRDTLDLAGLPDGELIRDGLVSVPVAGRTVTQVEIERLVATGGPGGPVTLWDASTEPPLVKRRVRAYRTWSAYGSVYLMAAGLMNLLLIFDAWDIGIGRKK